MRHGRLKYLVGVVLIAFLAACGSAPDDEVPALTLDPTPSRTAEAELVITGTVEPGAALAVQTTAQPQPIVETEGLDEAGLLSWSAQIFLNEGTNTVTASATDAVGNIRRITRQIVLDTTPPELTAWLRGPLAGSDPERVVLWLEFNQAVQVDTFIKDDGAPQDERFTVLNQTLQIVPGALTPVSEGEHSIRFYWEEDAALSPGEYTFEIPAGVADDLGNATTEPFVGTFTVGDVDAEL